MTALFILKIIGMVLLAIIGLVLVLLLLVLFCPFFYQIQAASREQIQVAARVTWLFGLVRITVSYAEKMNIVLRVFGIPIYNWQKKKYKSKYQETLSAKSDGERETTYSAGEDVPDIENAGLGSDVIIVSEKSESSHPIETDRDIADNKQTKSKTEKKTSKSRFTDKIKIFFQRLIRYISEIPDKILGLKDSISEKCQNMLDTIEYYQKLAEKPGTKKVFQFIKREAILILRHIKPYRGEVFVDYQADDPQKAAKLMQLYAVTLPILPKKTRVSSVFSDENKLEMQVKIKGRIFLFYLGYHALIILLNKKLKRFISLVKREE